ncbi:MAG: GlsB/YeaQ/YmgE family stress response membrane protein [Acidobacteria bacterium]|nr:GlsB/YeaQ/YmgE family stress response membrane protein [Acidobacteriota bacterium]
MGNLIGQIIFGLLVGIIAKFLMPGRDPGGFIITAILGMVGAVLGTFIGQAFWGANYQAGWIAAIIGSIILLAGYRFIASGSGVTSS